MSDIDRLARHFQRRREVLARLHKDLAHLDAATAGLVQVGEERKDAQRDLDVTR